MINRQLELEKLLGKLRESDTNNDSDIDLILKYLEKYLNNPAIAKGGSKKFLEFEIKNDPSSLSRIYQMTWKKLDIEDYEN